MRLTHSVFLRSLLSLAAAVLLLVGVRAETSSGEVQRVVLQRPGTLATLIGERQKFKITDLAIEGALNGSDLRFLREMAGSDYWQQPTEGRLCRLDLSRATFARGGETYIFKDTCVSLQSGPFTVPPFAFRGCRLEQVVLPERMDTIGVGAFEYTALRSIRIPEDVVVMSWVFNHCDSLAQVEFPQRLVELGQDCFRDCGSLRTLRIHDVQYLPFYVFQNVTGLEELVIDGTLWYAGGRLCDNCPQLRRIEFGGMVLATGGLFIASNCSRLSDITFSGFTLPIYYGAVENCPLVSHCRVTGSVMGSANSDFLPVIDVSTVSEALLSSVADTVSIVFAAENVSEKIYLHKDRIVRECARILAMRGMKKEACRLLRLLAESGYPFISRIVSDTAYATMQTDPTFIELKGHFQKNADFGEMIRRSPSYDTGVMSRGVNPQKMVYASADDSLLTRIRNYFNADNIAGAGSEVERLKNVMFWVHDYIKHRGNFFPATRRTAIDLVEGYRRAGRDGMNARGQAIVLAELYQSLGWPARFITCQSKFYADDMDATVVTVVWSFDLKKWVMMDASMAAYVTDENGLLLHPGEIRRRMKDGRPLLLNEEANWNHRERMTKENYLDIYMAKNLYYLSGYLHNRPGIESEAMGDYYTLVPIGEKVRIGIPVYDDAWFWQSPF
ncbi:MAG: leucine-rich repeat protein [Bacteroidaceae bacterium]